MPQHRSPALTAIYNELASKNQVKRILDLGQMRADNFNFFSQLKCNIHVENLNDFVTSDAYQNDNELTNQLKKYLISQIGKQKFDLILAWDLFNYLPIESLKAFLEFMQPHCAENCMLHLLSYTQKNIPVSPRGFKIIDQYFIELDEPESTIRQKPTIATYNLLKHAPGYVMQESLLNKEGMHPGLAEYLLRFSPQTNRLTKKAVLKTEQEDINLSKGLPIHRSPSFKYIVPNAEKTLLDLGPTNHHNTSWFAKRFKSVYSENIIMALRSRAQANVLDPHPSLGASTLNFEQNTQFDYILLWDTLNYLSNVQMSELLHRLQPFMHNQTVLMAYLYSISSAPKAPRLFKICPQSHMAVADSGLKPMEVYPHNAIEFSKALPGLKVTQSALFKEGMLPGITEYVFSYQSN